MTRLAAAVAMLCAAVVLALPAAPAGAKSCGKVNGAPIVTHGVSCKKAKSIYRAFKAGRTLPKGWVCGLSAGGCSRGSRSFTFRLNG